MKNKIIIALSILVLAGSAVTAGAAVSRTTADRAGRISIKKATGPNAVTVEEAYRDSARLEGKNVVIRGKVVKITAGIMGKNWIHIQDGTGASGTYDLTCTSSEDQALPLKDSVITVTGTLGRNRDFGAGYFYNVILENARIRKQ